MRTWIVLSLAVSPLALLSGAGSAQDARHTKDILHRELRHEIGALERHRDLQLHELQRHAATGLPAFDARAFEELLDELWRDGPAPGNAGQDSADVLWRQGREHLNARRYREAVQAFSRLRTGTRYANSTYRADAHYWEAYALSRMGGEEDLQQARTILDALLRFPPAQRTPDTEGLMVAVQSRLARLGNRAAEEALVARAAELASVGAAGRAASADQARLLVQQAAALSETSAALAGQSELLSGQHALLAPALQGLTLPSEYIGGLVWAGGLPGAIPAQCRTDQEELRMAALNALARLDAASATPILREVMARRGECSEYLRRQALTIAAQHRTPESSQLLLEATRNDPDRMVRVAALQLLIEVDEGRALTVIEQRLRNTSDTTGLREALAAARARTQNDRFAAMLRDLAARTDVPVSLRRDAILGLSRRSDAETQRVLRQIYRQTQEQRLRQAVLVVTPGDAENADWLLAIAADTTDALALRRAALRRAAAIREVPVERLGVLYDRFGDREMKSGVIEALSMRARTDRAATDKLLAIGRTESDLQLRKQAVLALSHSDDPRARELLMEILRR